MKTNIDPKTLGFTQTVNNVFAGLWGLEIGRGRRLTLGGVGTPNEMLTLSQTTPANPKEISDLIVLHNYDYDGYLSRDRLISLLEVLKPQSV